MMSRLFFVIGALLFIAATRNTLAATPAVMPDDPGFWKEYQLVVAKITSVTRPPAKEKLAPTRYVLIVVKTLRGSLSPGAVLLFKFDPTRITTDSITPDPRIGGYWLTAVENGKQPRAVVYIDQVALPVEVTGVDDPLVERIRKAVQP